jgi:hypothetical protein
MNKLIQLLSLFLLTGLSAQSQKYELGEVTIAELQEKTFATDPTAPAVILFSKGESSMAYSDRDGFNLVTQVEMKIKIYTKEGYDWANKIVAFYNSETDRENVAFKKAITYNLVNGEIKKTKLKSEGEFTEQTNKYWKQKKIMMPDVKEGSIVEFQYTILSPFIHVLPDWKFQETIPVKHSEFTTRIPEYYIFNPNFRGFYAPKVSKSFANKSIITTSKERTGVYVSKTTFSTDKTNYMENTITYSLDNLPAMKSERYVNNINNYSAGIEHELSVVKYPDQPVKTYSTNWEDVTNTIYKYDGFGPELKKTGYFEDDIQALLSGLNTPAEKIAAIFSYVKSRMNWNQNFGYTCDDGVKKAYTNKVGNAAEINLMLTAMLRYAKLDANPVLVSTRSNKIALFANRTAFNYVIASVELDNKTVLLDATSKSAMPNILPARAINWMGRIIRNNGTSAAVDLTPQTISREQVNLMVQLDGLGKATGTARDIYSDYNAYNFRENYSGLSEESYLEKLEGNYKGIEIANHKVTNVKELSKPVMEEYSFTHNSIADVIGDKMYITPLLFLTPSENPFIQEKREYPIDFVFPHQDKYMVTLTLPDGYVVESMPQSLSLSMEENIGSFKYMLANNGKQIQASISLDLNYANVSADYYETLKGFFQKVIEKQNEKIVLKKQ